MNPQGEAPTAKKVRFADEASAGPKTPHKQPLTGATSKEEILGVDRPFRNPNATHKPDSAIVDKMNGLNPDPNMDCSEIANILHKSAGKGRIIQVTGKDGARLKLLEHGKVSSPEFVYHQVFTDGKYVYDPRLGTSPIPLGDWQRFVRGLNPGAIIK